jgi:serine O-acetyltransferase
MFDNIKGDLGRLTAERGSIREMVRGVLSQGFQAIAVYRFFHWLKKKKIP